MPPVRPSARGARARVRQREDLGGREVGSGHSDAHRAGVGGGVAGLERRRGNLQLLIVRLVV